MTIGINLKGVSGIYSIVSKIDGKEYIGSAKCLYSRAHHHRFYLKNNKHCNGKLQNYYNKHGVDSIFFEVVQACEPEELVNFEQYHMDERRPFFNILKIARSSIGFRHTEAAKKKLSEMRKLNPTNGMLGRNHLESTKKKIAYKAKERGLHPAFLSASKKANTGRVHTKEHRRVISEKQMGVGFEDLATIQLMIDKGIRQVDIAKKYRVSQRVISRIKNRVGIYGELDKDYYEAACKRFNQETAQQAMAL